MQPGGEHERFGERAGELMRMEQETHRLARQVRRAEGAERAELERELRERLAELLERQERVEALERTLDEERETLRERRRNRDEILERRLRDLLGEGDVLDWD